MGVFCLANMSMYDADKKAREIGKIPHLPRESGTNLRVGYVCILACKLFLHLSMNKEMDKSTCKSSYLDLQQIPQIIFIFY